MKILIVGSRGQLGSKLLEILGAAPENDVVGADLPELDIARREAVAEAVRGLRPETIVNCAAYTNVELAEEEPEKAYAVNAAAVRTLADEAARLDARLVHISTDYVFSGRFSGPPRPYGEGDLPGPINVYGASKLAGEAVLELHPVRSLVLRTSWLYGGPGRNFLDVMIARGREAAAGGPPLRVVDDQVGSPTDAWSLALQVRRLLGEDARGLYHASCRGQTTWCGLARAILRGAGIGAAVTPVTSAEYPTRARRPPYSALSGRHLEGRGLSEMPDWEEGLRGALERRGLGPPDGLRA